MYESVNKLWIPSNEIIRILGRLTCIYLACTDTWCCCLHWGYQLRPLFFRIILHAHYEQEGDCSKIHMQIISYRMMRVVYERKRVYTCNTISYIYGCPIKLSFFLFLNHTLLIVNRNHTLLIYINKLINN